MDTRTQTSESQHPYPYTAWSTTTTTQKSSSGPAAQSPSDALQDAAAAAVSNLQYTPHLELLPLLLPQQSIFHAQQLLHYNKLISPARGGGGLQTPPLPPIISAPNVHAASRPRSSSKASLRETAANKGTAVGGHGGRSYQSSEKTRPVVPVKEIPIKMAAKQGLDLSRNIHQRSIAASTSPNGQAQSSSVPSTPHQHARQFSFESREPSPTNANGHSPRSAYSETNSTLPSLRPLPPRLGGCKYETAQMNSRRRIPYSVGNDRLQKLNLQSVKSKLSESEEKKLIADMREVYGSLLPTDEVEENRKKLVRKLETIFNNEWPGHDIKVNLFGSSGNLLCSDDSDVDICITTSWRELEAVCKIADLLARRGMEKVVCISAAKVPIVKIWDPELGLACDMNVNNTLALENTRMVRTYVEIDPRVRQLAMIIKYWTRRRIVNDAAFGGTLSSYTWICLIIAFLQLRDPPVLPSLHQLPYKTTLPDGTVSDFADNLNKLQGFGSKNQSSEADLLFQFFRFYAHEFDYDKHVLSVREGKLITKLDKKWHYGINNQLCVEEPFNTSRNLGNTADEYSFRGLHLELRRAFDLISSANFEEACEQYVFPKEEERVWSRPASQPRPVLLRSSSQSHSGRGGRGNHRGGRHNNNYRHGGGTNRRASSSVPTYEPSVYALPVNMQQDMSWFQNPQLQFSYAPQDIMAQVALHENMRQQLHLYAQSPAFLQHQGMTQQRLSATVASAQQSADRSRTNSFDNAPINAAFRPDLYAVYGMGVGHFYPPTTGYGTYPSSPVATNGAGQEYRRPLQRTTLNADAGVSTSSSSHRSQSQPASRSPSGAQSTRSRFVSGNHVTTGYGVRTAPGIPIPNFVTGDGEEDEASAMSSDLAQSLDESGAPGSCPARGSSPGTQHPHQHRQSPVNGVAYEDQKLRSSQNGRRLSTEKLPQTILDRRMKRTSRSPSPLGHARAFSTGTSPAPAPAPTQTQTPPNPIPSAQNKALSRPLVVNGSGLKTALLASARPPPPPKREPATTEDTPLSNAENALHIMSSLSASSVRIADSTVDQMLASGSPMPPRNELAPTGMNDPSLCLIPCQSADDASFRERIAMMSIYQANSYHVVPDIQIPMQATRGATSSRQRPSSRQPPGGAVAPLDLATSDQGVGKSPVNDMAHLSPVYEARTPSPTAFRKRDGFGALSDKMEAQTRGRFPRNDTVKPTIRVDDPSHFSQDGYKPQDIPKNQEGQRPVRAQKSAAQSLKGVAPRENGHVRSVRSEADGAWQKAGKGKRKGAASASGHSAQGEQAPKNEAERKGG